MWDKQGDVGLNLILKSVRMTIISVDKRKVIYTLSGCLFSYPARNALAPIILSSVACLAHWPNHNFPQYFIKGMILGKISY
jgi:hypothetical protein